MAGKGKEAVTVTLNNGVKMPVIGLGLASQDVRSLQGSAPLHHIRAALLTAIQVGYRTLDTANTYFTESILGETLKEAFEKGLVTRQDVFVTSKIWPTQCYPGDVVPTLRKSLETLKLEYLDLYLIHWPVALRKGAVYPYSSLDDVVEMDFEGVWRAMEECVKLGLTKSIGVSNFSSKKLQNLIAFAEIPPAVNQVEMHPVWQQTKLREYCKTVNVHLSAWSPLGGPGTPWGSTSSVLDNPLIKEIAKKHDKTPAQVALRWGIEKGGSVMSKSYNPARIAENFQIFDWELDGEDHDKIESIPQSRGVTTNLFVNPINGPFTSAEEFWDGEI